MIYIISREVEMDKRNHPSPYKKRLKESDKLKPTGLGDKLLKSE